MTDYEIRELLKNIEMFANHIEELKSKTFGVEDEDYSYDPDDPECEEPEEIEQITLNYEYLKHIRKTLLQAKAAIPEPTKPVMYCDVIMIQRGQDAVVHFDPMPADQTFEAIEYINGEFRRTGITTTSPTEYIEYMRNVAGFDVQVRPTHIYEDSDKI